MCVFAGFRSYIVTLYLDLLGRLFVYVQKQLPKFVFGTVDLCSLPIILTSFIQDICKDQSKIVTPVLLSSTASIYFLLGYEFSLANATSNGQQQYGYWYDEQTSYAAE